MPITKVDSRLRRIAMLLIVFIGISGVYSARGLYSDGSHWLIEMLPRGGFFIFDPHRAFVQILEELPVVTAIWLGVLDLNVLIRAHSFGFIAIPLAFWLGALWLHTRTNLFWFFILAFSVSYLRSGFFAAGEFSTAYAMTAFCAAILLSQRISYLNGSLLVGTAIILIYSYEATAFLGIFLTVLVALRVLNHLENNIFNKLLMLFSAIIFMYGAYRGAQSMFFLRAYDASGPANFSAFAEIHLLYLMIVPALMALSVSNHFYKYQKLLMVVLTGLPFIYLMYVFRWDHSNISFGYLSYAYRALCTFLLLGVLSIAVGIFYWPRLLGVQNEVTTSHFLSTTSMLFFLSMVLPFSYHTYGFYKWAQRFELEAVSIKSHVPIDKTTINSSHGWTDGYNWPWGNPSTSILLRGNAEAIILNNSTHQGAEPVDHETIDKYPLKPFKKNSLLFP